MDFRSLLDIIQVSKGESPRRAPRLMRKRPAAIEKKEPVVTPIENKREDVQLAPLKIKSTKKEPVKIGPPTLEQTLDGPNNWFNWDNDRDILLDTQVQAESNYDPNAVSRSGAKGLAQFMDPTWKDAQKRGWVASDASPFDPDSSIQAQTHYMKWLYDRPTVKSAGSSDERVKRALAAYNWGIGNIGKTMEKYGGDYSNWEQHLPEETRNYVAKIVKNTTDIKNSGKFTPRYNRQLHNGGILYKV